MGLILILILIFAGCSNSSQTPTDLQDKKEDNSLKIGVFSIGDILPLVVGIENKYFADNNVQVELVYFQSAVEKESAFQSGHLDGIVTDMAVAYLLKEAGVPLKITSITTGVDASEGRFGVATAPNSGLNSLQDLKDKKVGVSLNTIIEYVFDGLLLQEGLAENYAEKIPVPKIPVRLEMLLSGQLDAAVLPDPLLAFAEFQGATIIADDTVGDNLSQVVLLFHDNIVNERTAVLKSFYKAYSMAVEDINSNRENYRELFVEKAKVPAPIAEIYIIPSFPQPEVPSEEDVQRILNWLQKKDLVKGNIFYKDLVAHGLY